MRRLKEACHGNLPVVVFRAVRSVADLLAGGARYFRAHPPAAGGGGDLADCSFCAGSASLDGLKRFGNYSGSLPRGYFRFSATAKCCPEMAAGSGFAGSNLLLPRLMDTGHLAAAPYGMRT